MLGRADEMRDHDVLPPLARIVNSASNDYLP